jgi:hypothetical protein
MTIFGGRQSSALEFEGIVREAAFRWCCKRGHRMQDSDAYRHLVGGENGHVCWHGVLVVLHAGRPSNN